VFNQLFPLPFVPKTLDPHAHWFLQILLYRFVELCLVFRFILTPQTNLVPATEVDKLRELVVLGVHVDTSISIAYAQALQVPRVRVFTGGTAVHTGHSILIHFLVAACVGARQLPGHAVVEGVRFFHVGVDAEDVLHCSSLFFVGQEFGGV